MSSSDYGLALSLADQSRNGRRGASPDCGDTNSPNRIVPASTDASAVWTSAPVDRRFEGDGFGAKTLEQVATELALTPGDVLKRLADAGVSAARAIA